MQDWYVIHVIDSIVTELALSLLPDHPDLGPDRARAARTAASRYVVEQVAGIPLHLRPPLALAVLAFDWGGYLRHGRRFVDLPPPLRDSYICFWETRLPRHLVRLVRGLAWFAWYDHPLVMRALEEQD